MSAKRYSKGLSFKDEAGVTLAEILIAFAVIMIGLAAVMQAFPLATQGTDTGRRQSTAAFLAEQKIEEIRAWSLAPPLPPPPLKGFDNMPASCGAAPDPACPPGTPFAFQDFNTIPGYPEYSRTVIVQNGPSPTGNTRLVRVTVSYRRVTSTGVFTGGTQVSVETLIAKR
ncbi:MAG: type IV pilus modification PilV family protein [Nitrospiraceae bacterium]